MKKLLLVICINSIATTIYAQGSENSELSRMQVGIAVGPNLTHIVTVYNSHPFNDKHKPGISYSSGLFFQYNFSSTSSIHTEIVYARKSVWNKITYSDITGQTEWKEYLIYQRLILPVLYRISFNNFFINAGVYGGYAANNVYALKNPVLINGESRVGDPYRAKVVVDKPFYKGILAGIGYNFINEKSYSLSFELRDDFEFTTMESFDRTNRYRINTINLLFGFAFKL